MEKKRQLESPTFHAKRYQAMIDRYEELRERALKFISNEDEYDTELLDEVEELQQEMVEFNKKFINSPHYIIPDNELTKH